MFLDKIQNRETGILLYGTTPPKAHNSYEKNHEIAQKAVSRLQDLNIDGLVIYDLQDESSRTAVERPFPFLPTLDPYIYASEFLQALTIPKIIYRSIGKYSGTELQSWINSVQHGKYATVFVGAPSKDQPVNMKLSEAYDMWQNHNQASFLGGVTIFERHNANRSEHLKIVNKMNHGCRYFITQCVFNVGYAKDVLSDLYFYCLANNLEIPTIIFTLTTCGSKKTLQFMDWLGIHLPAWLRNELHHSQDILSKSVELSLETAKEIINFCSAKSIPYGINIESVSIRKEEIDASIYLLNQVEQLLQADKLKVQTRSIS